MKSHSLTNYAQQIQAKLVLREDNKGNVIVDGNLVDLPWRTYSFQLDTDIPLKIYLDLT